MAPEGRASRCVKLTIALVVCVSCCAPVLAGTTPNVVLIVADDAGYNEFGYTGGTPFLTPNIDALAATGIRFTSGYVVSPVCSVSRAALMTGWYPQRFGYERNISDDLDGDDALSASQVTLIQRFHDLGYTTGVIGKWHLGAVDGVNRPLDKGADEFFGLLGGGRPYWGGVTDPEKTMRRGDDPVEDSWVTEGDPTDYDPVNGRYVTDAFGDEAAAFIEAHYADPEPLFLLVSLTAPHTPLTAKEQDLLQFPALTGTLRTRAAMMFAMDRAVGKVLDALTAHAIAGDTIVVFVNDNGGTPSGDNSPFRGYKADAWEGGIRVPFLMRGPGLPVDIDYDRPITTLDLTPTLLAAAGGTLPPTDGVDLAPYLNGQMQGDPHGTLFFRFGEEWSVRDGDWKVIKADSRTPVQLFDLAADPGETTDLAAQNATVVDDLLHRLTLWEAGLEKPRWGVAGNDDRNLFDRFRFNAPLGLGARSVPVFGGRSPRNGFDDEQGGASWSDSSWYREDTSTLVLMHPEDAYPNAILEFAAVDASYGIRNDMTRITGQPFMLNELRCTGEFAGDFAASASIDGNPLLFTRDLSGAGPTIRLDATASGAGVFTFDVQTDMRLLDDLQITGDGTQPLVLSGVMDEELPGAALVKAGTSHVTVAGSYLLTGSLRVDAGRLTLAVDMPDLDSVVVGVLPATLAVSPGAVLIADTLDVLPGGVLEIGIADSGPGGFGRFFIAGNATLEGALTVDLLPGYSPLAGDTFEILTAATITGTATPDAFPSLPPPLGWSVAQDTDSVTISILEIPDYDGDGLANDVDNCISLHNPVQSDFDADLEGDACDLTDGLIYIAFESPTLMRWQEESTFDAWNLYRGDLDVLKATGVYTQAPLANALAGRACNLHDPWVDDFSSPPVGKVAFFLITGISGNTESDLDSFADTRPNVDPCPISGVDDFDRESEQDSEPTAPFREARSTQARLGNARERTG